jgi:hypothetical protein
MKALTLVLCILALLGSAASGYFWYEVGNKRAAAEAEAASEKARADGLQTNLAQTSAALEQKSAEALKLDTDLSDTKRNLTAAQATNVQSAREIETLKRTLATKDEAERKLNSDLDSLRRELVQTRLASQVGSPEELNNARQTIAALEARIAEIQGTAPAGSAAAATTTSSASPAPAARSERTAAARVAEVGSKNAFVVLELGAADGIAIGNKFSITRDGATIAEAVVSEVKDTFAIAQVAPASIRSALRAGDVAAYQN